MDCPLLCVALLCWLAGSYAQDKCLLITPSVLHVGFEETIMIDGRNSAFDAEVLVEDFPARHYSLVKEKVSVNAGNQFLGAIKIKITSKHYTSSLQRKDFVTVRVMSPSCSLSKVVLVSFDAGYIFIQTDKTVYTAGSTVLARFYTVNYNLKHQTEQIFIIYQDPDNVIIKKTTAHSPKVVMLSFRLDHLAPAGVWSITAFYANSVQRYTAHFEVKNYVQSDVEINIKPREPYYYIQDQDFTIQIQATYRHGSQVNGDAFVLFGAKKDDERKRIPDAMKKTKIFSGEGKAILEKKDLQKAFKNEEEMTAWTLYVSVTVITDTAGIVKAEMENIPIAKKLHKIIFRKSPEYFKPGLPYDFTVLVTNPDGSPAHGVPVVVQPGQLRGITQDNGTVKLTLNTETNLNSLQITAKTEVLALANEHQATASMTATAYKPVSGNYLHLSVTGTELLRVGKNVAINFNIQNSNPAVQSQINHFTYLVLSRGKIIKVGRQERKKGQALLTLVLPVTWDFLPSFRFMAYYVIQSDSSQEIVSDSVWIDVEDSCLSSLEITDTNRRGQELGPRSLSKVKLTAEYRALVGLLIVEKDIYEQNAEFRLSQKKVWDIVGKSDSGCTAGAGANGLQVFYDAGLALTSNFGMETEQRSEYLCKGAVRRVRRSLIDDGTMESIAVRMDSLDTWWWRIEEMSERPDRNGVSSRVFNLFLKDIIAAWKIVAVSLVEGKGICVASPHEIKVMQSFFIDLKVPHSVELNKQVEIYAILYNNKGSQIKVHVEWTYNPELCSASNTKRPYYQEVTIQSFSSVRVPFVFVPTSFGSHVVEVKAAGLDAVDVSDGIQKKIMVVPKGNLVHTVKSIRLEPAVNGKDNVQVEKIMPLGSVDKFDQRASIYTTFTIQAPPIIETVETSIDGAHLSHLIKEVKGNGESNMMGLTANVIAALYLDTTNQWSKLQLNRRDEAIQRIQSGILNQLTFRKSDSSFGQSIASVSSTWLTAYIVKIFTLSDTKKLFPIEKSVICGSVKWLVEKQKPDGSFQESSPVTNQEMMGGNKRTSSELETTLTSFVLVAILKSKNQCLTHVHYSPIEKTVEFLKAVYPSLQNPYSVAITSYALALAGGLQDTNVLTAASTGSYWNDPSSRFVSIEATSYALLTLIEMQDWNPIARIVQWLIEQHFYGDATGQTQATVMMFQALDEYYQVAPTIYATDMEILLQFSKRDFESFFLNSYNTVTHSREMSVNDDCTITAKGKGLVNVTIIQSYYRDDAKMDCGHYNLSVTAQEEYPAEKPKDAISTVAITICVRSLKSNEASVAIVEVVMLSGFIPDTKDLNKLKERKDMNIDFNERSHYKGHLIFYLSKVSQTEKLCLAFKAHQYTKMDYLQPASVTIYDYDTPDNRCTKFYHVREYNQDLSTVCKGDTCRCAEVSGCYIEHQTDDNNPDFLYNKICETNVDYAYKATLSDIEHGDRYITHVMTIQRVFKEGADEVSQGQKRHFLNHKKCQHFPKLEKGRDYFVWGASEDSWSLPSEYSYIIGRDMWFEWYPNRNDCQNPENTYICEKAQQLEDDLDFKGCML